MGPFPLEELVKHETGDDKVGAAWWSVAASHERYAAAVG